MLRLAMRVWFQDVGDQKEDVHEKTQERSSKAMTLLTSHILNEFSRGKALSEKGLSCQGRLYVHILLCCVGG